MLYTSEIEEIIYDVLFDFENSIEEDELLSDVEIKMLEDNLHNFIELLKLKLKDKEYEINIFGRDEESDY